MILKKAALSYMFIDKMARIWCVVFLMQITDALSFEICLSVDIW
jgi:hypothetical protein